MRQPSHNTAKLPRQLLDELGVSGEGYNGARKKRVGPSNRKEQRKAARVQKKSSHGRSWDGRPQVIRQSLKPVGEDETPSSTVIVHRPQIATSSVQPKAPKSILKIPTPEEKFHHTLSPSPPPPGKVSRAFKDRLAADDAEIAALEKKLGIKQSTKLPRSFQEDGLDSLLEGIDDAVDLNATRSKKRKKTESDVWLESKRAKAQPIQEADEDSGRGVFSLNEENSAVSDDGNIDDGESEPGGPMSPGMRDTSDEEGDESDVRLDLDERSGSDPLDDEDTQFSHPKRVKKARENPYVAPVVADKTTNGRKYLPPSLRTREIADSEDLSQLRRQIQGLLNRLSEANLVSILGDVETIYRGHPRRHVSTALLDLLMGLLSDPTTLQDTFIILHAGFIAAIYKVSGTDFGAQTVQRIDEVFALHYYTEDHSSSGKRLTNLVSLLTELYNFQVISSNLIYDYVRIFLDDISETNTELLLKVVRNAGPQLRQDDPSALKDIILQLQKAVTKEGEESLSVRTKFMIESLNNLKNNRMKTGITASTVTSEHTTRMKKILGTLNQRNVRASEPLRIGLNDVRGTEKRGKWWVVGASYRDSTEANVQSEAKQRISHNLIKNDLHANTVAADLMQLAKEQRMNTDIRRSIFVAIMSSNDVNDAYIRLMKLSLKKSQELEIPKVLIQCAGAENFYNAFYTILSRRLCSDRKLRIAFQFSLWDLFKRMGETDDELEDDEDEEGEGKLGLRSLVNLAKMFGVLIAEDGLSLGVLKNLNLACLQPKTRTFCELLIITAIVHSQIGSNGRKDEKAMLNIFVKPKEALEMAGGLRYFLKKVVSKTDVAGGKLEKEMVRWGCKIAGDALTILGTQKTIVGE
ncbi:nucleolar MIF4G domain-containing protein 1, partial [Lecanoromycetidae sp. Uapishka_2]